MASLKHKNKFKLIAAILLLVLVIIAINYFDDESYTMSEDILKQIEFDAVLAHEYLHIWQDIFNIKLNESKTEGLSNLASEIIYEHYNNQFSRILKTTLENDSTIYGIGYKKMKIEKNELGWDRFIQKIKSNYSY